MSENVSQYKSPERLFDELESPAQIAHETLKAVYSDTIEQQQEYFQTITEKALSMAATQSERKAIETACGIVEWRLFADYGSPLPKGLIVKEGEHTKNEEIALDPMYFIKEPRRKLLDFSWFNVGDILLKNGFKELLKYREAIREQPANQELLQAGFKKAVKKMPFFRLLEAFDDRDDNSIQDVPLNIQEQRWRERGNEEQVRRRYNLNPQVDINTVHAAKAALLRSNYKLDDERLQKIDRKKANTPLQRVRRFFMDKVFEYEGTRFNTFNKYEIDCLGYNENDAEEVFIYPSSICSEIDLMDEEQRNIREIPQMSAWQLSHNIAAYLGVGEGEDWAQRDLLRECVKQIILSESAERPYTQTLDLIASEVATEAFSPFMYDDLYWHSPVHYWIKNPPILSLYSEDQFQEREERYRGSRVQFNKELEASFSTKEELDKKKQIILGTVTTSSFSQKTKLIQLTAPSDELPLRSSKPALVFEATNNFPIGVDPSIPGYRLVARDVEACRFEFAKEEQEPYEEPYVVIPQEGVNELIGLYRQIGLHNVEALAKEELTVEELRQFLEENSTYYAPTQTTKIKAPKQIQDYKQLVAEGKMHVQCDYIGNFLVESLNVAFNKDVARIVTGYTFSGSGKVDSVPHAQVAFYDGSRSYICDPTPAQELPSYATRAAKLASAMTARIKPPAAPPQEVRNKIIYSPDNATIPRYSSEVLREELEMQLGVIYEATNPEALYKKVVALPDHHPVKRGVQLFKRVHTTPEEIDAYLRYLQNIDNAPIAQLTKYGLENYSGSSVSAILRSYAHKLQVALAA